MFRPFHILSVTLLILLLSAVSHGAVDLEIFERTIVSETGAPTLKSFRLAGSGGAGALHLVNGSSAGSSDLGVTRVIIRVNGQAVMDVSDLGGTETSLSEDIEIIGGGNLLEVISIANPGAQFTTRITQKIEAEAAFVIGPEGGTFVVTDPGAGSSGVKVKAPENSFTENTIVTVHSFPQKIYIPLFPQFQESVSPVVTFRSTNLPSDRVSICFPLSNVNGEVFSLHELKEEENDWISIESDFGVDTESGEPCTSIDHFSTYAITAESTCGAPGASFFNKNVSPGCREKWEGAVYLTVVYSQFEEAIGSIYANSISETLSIEDVTGAFSTIASRTSELQGINSKNVDDLWVNSETEISNLAAQLYGSEFAGLWFNTMLQAFSGLGTGGAPVVSLNEEDFTSLNIFLDSLPAQTESLKINELNVSNAFLLEFYRFGTDLERVRESLGLIPDTDEAGIIQAIAANMGISREPQNEGYDMDRVLNLVNDSLALVYQITKEITSPTAATLPASDITINSAALNGTVTASGLETSAFFEWSTDPNFETYNASPTLQAGTAITEEGVTYSLGGLTPLSTYYYRIAASNDSGKTQGPIESFTTIAIPPTVSPSHETPVTTSSATLTGTVNPNELETEGWFEWSTDSSLSPLTETPKESMGSGAVPQPLTFSLSDLETDTTYYYRVSASNKAGVAKGPILSFTIPDFVATTSPALDIGINGAILAGVMDSKGEGATAWFEWSSDSTFSLSQTTPVQSIRNGTDATTMTYPLTGLSPNRTYYYRFIVSIGSETKKGKIMSFTTSPAGTLQNSTTVKWLPPTENEDGTVLTDLAGYRVYYGTSSLNYSSSVDVGYVTQFKFYNLPPGTWFFAVTAYDTLGNESAISNELGKLIN